MEEESTKGQWRDSEKEHIGRIVYHGLSERDLQRENECFKNDCFTIMESTESALRGVWAQ